MYKKTLTYTDFKGQKRTEELCFNMTEVELMKWAAQPSGYTHDQLVDNMLKKGNTEGLMDMLDDLFRRSYGELSLDGKRFVKSPEIQQEFFESNAYPALFLELATNSEEASRFFNEVFPANINETLAKFSKKEESVNEKEIEVPASGQPMLTNA